MLFLTHAPVNFPLARVILESTRTLDRVSRLGNEIFKALDTYFDIAGLDKRSLDLSEIGKGAPAGETALDFPGIANGAFQKDDQARGRLDITVRKRDRVLVCATPPAFAAGSETLSHFGRIMRKAILAALN